ncbi:helix-turn-helix domain-containing protein [Dactylosporangium sp. CA-139066]|uniref:helix-turn-helix domain-containing protein n=1 Tax=Dactylosporangium sp. CA-139066 TaxID=3239930 RepID=UPI003D927634
MFTESLPRHQLDVPDPAPVPVAVGGFEWFGDMARAAFAHRHAFYEIVLLTAGRGAHVIDLHEYALRPPQLFVIAPGQVHYWRNARGLAGRLLVFGDEALLAYPGDRRLLLQAAPAVRLRAREARGLGGLFNDLAREYADRPAGFESVLPALLHVLVVRAHRLGAATGSVPSDPLAAAFVRLINDNGGERSVAAYARRLNTRPQRLAEAVKAATGEPPGRLIRRAQALEARRLLARTELSVAQVGRAAGFADPAYFSRFFRREVGLTPKEYREKHQERPAQSIDGDGCTA